MTKMKKKRAMTNNLNNISIQSGNLLVSEQWVSVQWKKWEAYCIFIKKKSHVTFLKVVKLADFGTARIVSSFNDEAAQQSNKPVEESETDEFVDLSSISSRSSAKLLSLRSRFEIIKSKFKNKNLNLS